MNIKKYCGSLLCAVSLVISMQIKTMDYSGHNGALITASVLFGGICLIYGSAYFMHWLKTMCCSCEEQNISHTSLFINDDVVIEPIAEADMIVTQGIELTGQGICKIALCSPGKLFISQVNKGEKEYFCVKAHERAFNNLLIQIYGNNLLSCEVAENKSVDDEDIVYHLALRNIHAIAVSGNVKSMVATPVITSFLHINLANNACFTSYDTYIKAISLIAHINDNSMMWLAGKAVFQQVYLSERARYNTLCMGTQAIHIRASGSSIAEVSCVPYDNGKGKKLQATISGILSENSNVWFYGSPRITQLQSTGKSCIQHIMQ